MKFMHANGSNKNLPSIRNKSANLRRRSLKLPILLLNFSTFFSCLFEGGKPILPREANTKTFLQHQTKTIRMTVGMKAKLIEPSINKNTKNPIKIISHNIFCPLTTSDEYFIANTVVKELHFHIHVGHAFRFHERKNCLIKLIEKLIIDVHRCGLWG